MYSNLIKIDKMSHKPIYEQIVEQFQNLIVTGLLSEGDIIPSVRSLSVEIGTNPNTIQKAYLELEREKITYSVPGMGRYIADDAKRLIQCKMQESDEDLRLIVEKLKLSGMTLEEITEKVRLYYGGNEK